MSKKSELFNTKAEVLLETVKSSGDAWQSRQEIADRLGKHYLNPVEIWVLEMLAEQGRIEKAKLERTGIINFSVRYRGKEDRS